MPIIKKHAMAIVSLHLVPFANLDMVMVRDLPSLLIMERVTIEIEVLKQ